MTDRILTVEFPYFQVDPLQVGYQGIYRPTIFTEYRELRINGFPVNEIWLNESKIDLSGYNMEDLTVFFRNSFEQEGGFHSIRWSMGLNKDPMLSSNATILESVIISSVPLTDTNLLYSLTVSPGFIPPSIPNAWGNFNREHIIHGSLTLYAPDLTVASGDFNSDGISTLQIAQQNIFSSLEPTSADALYCYRIIALSPAYQGAGTPDTGVSNNILPAKRVLMSITTEKEPELSYMMRLKRSYELANQV